MHDVTPFLDSPRGGPEKLLSVGGKDGTATFEEVGHSEDARALRAQDLVGEIVPEQHTPDPIS